MSSSIVLSSFVFVKESKIYFYICDILSFVTLFLSFVTLFLSFLFYYYFLLSRLIYWSNASNAFYFISVEFCLSSFSFFSTSAFSSDCFAKIILRNGYCSIEHKYFDNKWGKCSDNVHLALDEQVMLIGLSTSNSFLGAMLQSVLGLCFGDIMKGKRSQVPVPITTKSWYGDICRRKADLQKD